MQIGIIICSYGVVIVGWLGSVIFKEKIVWFKTLTFNTSLKNQEFKNCAHVWSPFIYVCRTQTNLIYRSFYIARKVDTIH